MRADDLFVDDDFVPGVGIPGRRLDLQLVDRLRSGPVPEQEDIEVAVALARLVHDELEKYGTGGGEELLEEQMRVAIRALLAVTQRLGIVEMDIPFRGFGTFRSWWLKQGASGSYQARRDLLHEVFEPLHDRLALLEQRSIASTLVEPISPRARTGWAGVDTEIGELRRHFQNARTAQDYRAVGLDCVAVTEALSRQVYDPARHLRPGELEPPVSNTKQRLDRFIEEAAPGSQNSAIRKHAKSVVELAQKVKHSSTPTRREAGIAADAVIQLANLLRRLHEPAEG